MQLAATNATISFGCQYCDLFEIEAAAFIDVPNIFGVDLRHNRLTGDSIRADIFRGRYNNHLYEPISLVELNLGHNRIQTLNRNVFEHTTFLERLSLAHNPLNLMDPTTVAAIASVTSIKYLDLSWTNLTSLPNALFDKTLLQIIELNLTGNRLSVVPYTLRTLGVTLQFLHLTSNRFQQFTNDSFIGLDRLTHLSINDMTTLHTIQTGAFLSLVSLKVFNCSRNSNLTAIHLGSLLMAKNLQMVCGKNLQKVVKRRHTFR